MLTVVVVTLDFTNNTMKSFTRPRPLESELQKANEQLRLLHSKAT
jgi:hypothetical protein